MPGLVQNRKVLRKCSQTDFINKSVVLYCCTSRCFPSLSNRHCLYPLSLKKSAVSNCSTDSKKRLSETCGKVRYLSQEIASNSHGCAEGVGGDSHVQILPLRGGAW